MEDVDWLQLPPWTLDHLHHSLASVLFSMFVIGVSSVLPLWEASKPSWGPSFTVTHFYCASLNLPSFMKCHRTDVSGQCSHFLMSHLIWTPIFLIFIWTLKKYFTTICFIYNTVHIFNELKVKLDQGSFIVRKNKIKITFLLNSLKQSSFLKNMKWNHVNNFSGQVSEELQLIKWHCVTQLCYRWPWQNVHNF